MSVYKAARLYLVRGQTLRYRTKGLVNLITTVGFDKIFPTDEEIKLVEQVTYMAGIGYWYNKKGIHAMSKSYANSLGKTLKSDTS